MACDPDHRGGGEKDGGKAPMAFTLQHLVELVGQQRGGDDNQEQPYGEKLRGEKRFPAQHLDARDRAFALVGAAAEILDLSADPAARIVSVVNLAPIALGWLRRPAEPRPMHDVAHRLPHIEEREWCGAQEIAVGPVGRADEAGMPPGALHPERLDDAAVVFGDALPVIAIDGPVHDDRGGDHHQIDGEGPKAEIPLRIPGQLDGSEGADRQPEEDRQDIARRHQTAFVAALDVIDLTVDGIDDRDRIGAQLRPHKRRR